MQNKYSATYLGAMVNDQGNPNEELKHRMADTMATWKNYTFSGETQTFQLSLN